jgi:hypothetical protein
MLSRCRHRLGSPTRPIGYLPLLAFLAGRASETPWRTPITTASSSDSQVSAECSLVGRLGCSAMSRVSNDGSDSRQGICTATRNGGTSVETCGTAAAAVAAPLPPPPKPQVAGTYAGAAPRSSVQLSWKDNSNNETGFVIERCDQILRDIRNPKITITCRGAWTTVATVAANTTTYVDDTVTANQTYIYRVVATNQSGSSAHSPEAVITAPVR